MTRGPVADHFDRRGYEVERYGYQPVDAYMLCIVCADLRISSIVDVPNWVVSYCFPRIVLE